MLCSRQAAPDLDGLMKLIDLLRRLGVMLMVIRGPVCCDQREREAWSLLGENQCALKPPSRQDAMIEVDEDGWGRVDDEMRLGEGFGERRVKTPEKMVPPINASMDRRQARYEHYGVRPRTATATRLWETSFDSESLFAFFPRTLC